MSILITLLVIVAVAAVAVWLINLIPFPSGLEIVKTVMVIIVVVMALWHVLALFP